MSCRSWCSRRKAICWIEEHGNQLALCYPLFVQSSASACHRPVLGLAVDERQKLGTCEKPVPVRNFRIDHQDKQDKRRT
jgi:hypothetical protein